jgi:hypothetical protein
MIPSLHESGRGLAAGVVFSCVCFCVRLLWCLETSCDVFSFPKPGAQTPTVRKLRWGFLCFCSSLCACRSGN